MFRNKKPNFHLAKAILSVTLLCSATGWTDDHDDNLDRRLSRVLRNSGFTGRVESTLAQRLGRPLIPKLAITMVRCLWRTA